MKCPVELVEKLASDEKKRKTVLSIYKDKVASGDVEEPLNRAVVEYFVKV